MGTTIFTITLLLALYSLIDASKDVSFMKWKWYNERVYLGHWHSAGAALTLIFCLTLSIFYITITGYSLIDLLSITFFLLSLRWILFDLMVNIMLKLKWNYVGTTSWFDRKLGRYGLWLKLVMLFFSVMILIFK